MTAGASEWAHRRAMLPLLSAGALPPTAARMSAPYTAPRCSAAYCCGRPYSSSRPLLRVAAVPSHEIRTRGHTRHTIARRVSPSGGFLAASAGGEAAGVGAPADPATTVVRLTSAAEVAALLEVGRYKLPSSAMNVTL